MRFATVEIGGKGQPVVISPDGAKLCPVTALIFDNPTIIATSSAEIILKPGDTMTVSIDGMGALTNTIAN